jgi:hypothetical protein
MIIQQAVKITNKNKRRRATNHTLAVAFSLFVLHGRRVGQHIFLNKKDDDIIKTKAQVVGLSHFPEARNLPKKA